MPALAALAIVGLGAVAALAERQEAESRRDAADQRALGELVAAITGDTTRAIGALDELVEAVAARGPAVVERAGVAASVPGATGVAVLAREAPGPPRVTAGALGLDTDLLSEPQVAAVLDASRDAAEVRLGPPLGAPGAQQWLLVGSVHTGDSGAVDPSRLSVQARRVTATGWVVASIDPAALLGRHLRPGAIAAVADGSTVLAAPGIEPPSPGAPEMAVDVATRRWTIRAATQPEAVGWPVGSAIALAASLAVAALVVGALDSAWRRRARAEQESARRDDQLRLVGEIAPVLQQSLRLDDVLPMVAVQLSDHFGLTGVAISIPGLTGESIDLFVMGDEPHHAVTPALRPPDRAAPGETVALALDREGRTVAVLRLVVGEPLDRPALDSLRAVTELVTAAIVNTNLYRGQQDAMRRLRELDEMKTAFLGTASHELRTPVTAISGFSTLLADHWDRFGDEQRQELADRIAANAGALENLVQDLLDFSRLERGALRVQLQTAHLHEVVHQVVTRLTPALGDHRVETELHQVPPVALDPNGVERIITNLLTNAAKFSPPGSTVRVTTRLSPRGSELVIDDEGPGVAPGDRRLIFTRFYRGSGDHVTSTRGVGIGLSVVKEFADQMGAAVDVTDAPGGGARFIVAFPTTSAEGEPTLGTGGEDQSKESDSAPTS